MAIIGLSVMHSLDNYLYKNDFPNCFLVHLITISHLSTSYSIINGLGSKPNGIKERISANKCLRLKVFLSILVATSKQISFLY